MNERETIILGDDGRALTIDELVSVARDPRIRVAHAEAANLRIEGSARLVRDIVQNYTAAWERQKPIPGEYGVTTGFGEFKDTPIPAGRLDELQRNLLLSHSVGVGENVNADDLSNYYPAEVVRAALVIRWNTFLKGHSGVRRVLVDVLEAMLNCGIVPLVPLRGSVGASGDLCPLSHLFVTLLKRGLGDEREFGRFYRVTDGASMRDTQPQIIPASKMIDVLREEIPDLTIDDMQPRPKEGLALNNGANFSAAMLALGVHDARRLVRTADVAVAMTLQALGGSTRAFDVHVHQVRPHKGQIKIAERVLGLLQGSKLAEKACAVQDAYSLRCAPQAHGATDDAIEYVAGVAECEINSATDNPLFFPGAQPCDWQFQENWDPEYYDGRKRVSYSAGNFHGQPVALAADFLTIALAELANISERRTQMLLDANHNRNLPPNLTTEPGLNSGFMIAQYTAASLVSENKVLSHPASVDSIPTSANSEDHVSMSTHAARKMRTVLGNAQSVIAIELLAAAQAIEWRVIFKIPARTPVPKGFDLERFRPKDFEAAAEQARDFASLVDAGADQIGKAMSESTFPIYQRVREVSPSVVRDRTLDEDVRLVRDLVARGELMGES
jgi:histidine ammonia-lyase